MSRQWKQLTLDRYHAFVVDRLADGFDIKEQEVIEYMVVQWVSDHTGQVEQAGASIRDFLTIVGTEAA